MFDFHSHILPQLDDGSKGVEESIEMLQRSSQEKVQAMIATPHFYPERITVERFLEKRSKSAEKLKEAIGDSTQFPDIYLGAEVAFYENLNRMERMEDLCIGQSRFILIEMPMGNWSEHLLRSVYYLIVERNLSPIIAHIDRYFSFRGLAKSLDQLIDMGCLVQINGSFIETRRSRKIGMKLLKENKVHLLGSDCHNITNRPPGLQLVRNEIHKYFGIEKLESINKRSEAILGKCEKL